jgi:transposase
MAHTPDGVPYQLSFRQNVVHLHTAGGTYRAIATRLGCHHATAWRICQKYLRTGDPEAEKPPGYRQRMLSGAEAAVVAQLKLMLPSISGIEVQRMLQLMCNQSPSLATISRELDRMDFSFRRIRMVSVNRNPLLRMQHYTRPPPHGVAGTNGALTVNVSVR